MRDGGGCIRYDVYDVSTGWAATAPSAAFDWRVLCTHVLLITAALDSV